MARNVSEPPGPTGTRAFGRPLAGPRAPRSGDTLPGVVGLDLAEQPHDPEAERHSGRALAVVLAVVAAVAVGIGGLQTSAQREGAEAQASRLAGPLAALCDRVPAATASVGTDCGQADRVARFGVDDVGLGDLAAAFTTGTGPLSGDEPADSAGRPALSGPLDRPAAPGPVAPAPPAPGVSGPSGGSGDGTGDAPAPVGPGGSGGGGTNDDSTDGGIPAPPGPIGGGPGPGDPVDPGPGDPTDPPPVTDPPVEPEPTDPPVTTPPPSTEPPPSTPPADVPVVSCPEGWTAVPYGDKAACLPPPAAPTTTPAGETE